MTPIPDKQYFKIGEASRITGVKPHVLRYWESEFTLLRPQKSRTNQRLYRRRDLELLLYIKQLLYREGYTIAGANKHLRKMRRAGLRPLRDPTDVLEEARQHVGELVELVTNDEEDA